MRIKKESQNQFLIDLETLKQMTAQLERIQALAKEIKPVLDSMKELNATEDSILLTPSDRLVPAGEAAKILGVNQSTIGRFIKEGLLKPYYLDSLRKKFWLSDIKALPKENPQLFKDADK